MHTKESLAWVQRNKKRTDRCQPVGLAVERLVGGLLNEFGVSAGSVLGEVISPGVDDEFRRHCRVALDDRGVLIVAVDQPPLVAVMRRKWQRRLTEAVAAGRGAARVSRIVFEHGASGIRLDSPRQLVNRRENGRPL